MPLRLDDGGASLERIWILRDCGCGVADPELLMRDSSDLAKVMMIRHIVLFTAKDKSDIDEMMDGLSLLTKIPHARRLEIARNRKTDLLRNDIDVVVYGEFANDTELEAYRAHDLYQESIRRVRPLRELRFAADYDAFTSCVYRRGGGDNSN